MGQDGLCAKCFHWDREAEYTCVQADPQADEEVREFLRKDRVREEWLKGQKHVEIKQGGDEVQRTLDIHMASKVIKAKGRRALSPRTKGAYRAVVCNQVWTRKRLADAGYQTEP